MVLWNFTSLSRFLKALYLSLDNPLFFIVTLRHHVLIFGGNQNEAIGEISMKVKCQFVEIITKIVSLYFFYFQEIVLKGNMTTFG